MMAVARLTTQRVVKNSKNLCSLLTLKLVLKIIPHNCRVSDI